MEPVDRLFMIVDPISLRLVGLCSGPDASGKCPSGDVRPYTCEGQHVIPLRGTTANGLSFSVTPATVEVSDARHCPMSWVNDPGMD